MRIIPSIFFGSRAAEAADFYISLFPESFLKSRQSGDFSIHLWGTNFNLLAEVAEPSPDTPISYFVYCGTDSVIERIYGDIIQGGTIILPLAEYPWARKFAQVADRYGIIWQLDADDIRVAQKIVPCLHFSGTCAFRIGEAVRHYVDTFPESRILLEVPFSGDSGFPANAVMFAQCKLNGFVINLISDVGQSGQGYTPPPLLNICVQDEFVGSQIAEKWTQLTTLNAVRYYRDSYMVNWAIKIMRGASY